MFAPLIGSHKAVVIPLTLLIGLVACAQNPRMDELPSAGESPEVVEIAPSETHWIPTAGNTPTPFQTAAAQPSLTLPATSSFHLCIPFEGYDFEQLQNGVSNPFNPPPKGSDYPHQGVDLALVQNGIALAGEAVHAILTGEVSGVISDRFPYGNALLVETPLEWLPDQVVAQLSPSTAAPTLAPPLSLTCPPVDMTLPEDLSPRSLYILYAHMLEPSDYIPGDVVSCGQTIGKVGQSGNALNPHLHIEIRLGPASVRFNSLAHYETRVTVQEMANYCLWRVSGVFQLVDPMILLRLLQ